ncbi:hypothetical protein M514_03945 [Trichuris suis]|uniref:BLOC-1-related complex subunit 6 C-terminal helix domain-containing protein n=1 Tax=Trichuris suis TaxID=68888 RepID=A0A085N8V3_9BILA|nr:hypothetical protein M514_03945 [Trichuris suis]
MRNPTISDIREMAVEVRAKDIYVHEGTPACLLKGELQDDDLDPISTKAVMRPSIKKPYGEVRPDIRFCLYLGSSQNIRLMLRKEVCQSEKTHKMIWLVLFEILLPLVDCQQAKGIDNLMDYNDMPTITCESKFVPKWLKGYFIRQMCGSVGRTAYGNPVVSHFFDCVGMLGIYHINNGLVHFSSRFHQTHALMSIRENYPTSTIGWRTFRSQMDERACMRNEQTRPDISPYNPNMAFSPHGESILAYSHGAEFYQVNFREAAMGRNSSSRIFTRRSPGDPIVLHDTVYKTLDKNGTLWGTYLAVHLRLPEADIMRYVYKVEKGCQQKVIVAKIATGTVDRNMCIRRADGRLVFSQPMVEGYVHSIAVTENYIILTMSRGTFNPCLLLTLGEDVVRRPLLENFNFEYDYGKTLEATIITKQSLYVKFLDVTSTYQQEISLVRSVNAFEEGDGRYLYVDAFVYDAVSYFNFFNLQNLYSMSKDPFPRAALVRLTVDLMAESIKLENIPREFLQTDYPVINPTFLGRKDYRYIYAVQEPFAAYSSLLKIDIARKEGYRTSAWRPSQRITYLNEIAFVQFPRARAEDEGILLVSAVDATTNKETRVIVKLSVFDLHEFPAFPKKREAIRPAGHSFRFNCGGKAMGENTLQNADALNFYEEQFEHMSKQVELLLADLRGSLSGMSNLVAENIATFESVTNSACESAEAAIRASHGYIVGLEAQLKSMQSLRPIAAEIAQFRAFLEQCEPTSASR